MSLAKPIALIAILFLLLLWFAWPSHAHEGYAGLSDPVTALALPAQAQGGPLCGNRAAIIKTLALKYKEAPRFLAIASETNLVEIFISKAGTWTILVTNPTGKTCIVGAGDSWEELPAIIDADPET